MYSYWYKNGRLHRDNNKPAIIDRSGKYYYKNGRKYYPKGKVSK